MSKLINILLVIFVIAGCSASSSQENFKSVHPVIAAEPVSSDNFFRSRLLSNGQSEQIAYEAIVDEKGDVISFEMRDYYFQFPDSLIRSHLKRYADPIVEKTQFEPVIRNGQPIKFQTSVYVDVFPPERTAKFLNSMPPIDWNDLSITLSRSGCFGTCPSYTVEITGTGEVSYHGHGFVVVEGSQSYTISKDVVAGLVEKFDQANFWNLEDEYRAEITDSSTHVITFKTGSYEKTIVDYVGMLTGMPHSVKRLQAEIDRIAGTRKWISGDENTVPFLVSSGYDFQSIAAQKTLVSATDFSSEDLAIAILDQGVQLDSFFADYPDCSECGPNPTTFARVAKMAVRRYKTQLFDKLDQAGWIAKLDEQSKNELLFLAADANNPQIVGRLLELGAGHRFNNSTPLVAVMDNLFAQNSTDSDRKKVVRMLLAAGADVDATGPLDGTPLQHAYDDDIEFVKILLEAGANVNAGSIDPLNEVENTSSSILYKTENEDVALLVIGHGADIALRSEDGKTLAQLADERSWTKVKGLLDK